MVAYLMLGCAIALELVGTTFLKYSAGFTHPLSTIACLISYFFCFFLFSKAVTSIHLGAAYATWSAIGIVVSAILSAMLFGERLNTVGVVSLVLIITGCILLNLFGIAGK